MIGKITIYLVLLVALVSAFVFVGRVSYEIDPFSFFTQNEANVLSAFTADAWGVFDPQTGRILEGERQYELRSIASITKLFTAYSAAKSGMLDEVVTISWQDLETEGRAGKLSYGDRLTMRELLFPLLIESSNDAGEAIRRKLGTNYGLSIEIVTRDLGLTNTVIVDGSGLSNENRSTVNDLALFYSYLYREHPHILDITKLKVYIGEQNGWVNNDPAREIDTFTGGKHGYTYEAGRTFVGTFMVPGTDVELGLVLLGSSNLVEDIGSFTEYLARLH
jgi:D-alanyl-D-alanine carboxypeptidase